MSIDKERVEPAPFATAEPVPGTARNGEASRPGPARWTLPALGALLLLALAVVFWLPSALQPSVNDENGPAQTAPGPITTDADGQAATPAPAQATAPAGSPFAEAEAARLRGEAQEILNELLDLRDALTRRGADVWAGEALAAVTAAADQGDERYRQREFETAISLYRNALEQARAIEARIPKELTAALEATEAALQAGNVDDATTALSLVDKLDPALPEADTLRQRLDALPGLIAWMDKAEQAEQAGDLEAAMTALKSAVAADSENQRAQAALRRVDAALTEQRFTDAMSAGYAALDGQRFDEARAAFRRAGRLREGSAEVDSALQEVEVATTAAALRDLQRSAAASVSEEDWSGAVTAYESALEIDNTVLFARRGLDEARTRAELDKRLQAILEDPDRLSDERVAAANEELLAYARSVEPRGPVLAEQIRTLQKQLALANTPIEVTLLSDNNTDVVVQKVTRLGQFQRETLALRPGEYTAVGTRRGYRDVRETFRVSHDQRPPTVTVVCSESI